MEFKGTVIEIFPEYETKKKERRREFGVEYIADGKINRVKLTCVDDVCDSINDFTKGDSIEVDTEFKPWRNENTKEPSRPYYNHEFHVTEIK